jgi:hypothetical protein
MGVSIPGAVAEHRGLQMGDDQKREALLHEIEAWREAWAASKPDSPQHRDFQNKMKAAEWKLQALGPSQASPGIDIKIVGAEKKE